MEVTQKFFETTPVEREDTLVHAPDERLVTPRFDNVESQVARPVVPLAGSPVRNRRRQWPIALVLISALAGGVVSLLAFRLYQQQQSQIAATETDNQQTTNAVPTPEPTPSADTGATVTEAQAQTDAPLIFEEFDPAKEGVEISDAELTRKADAKPAAARRDESKDETKPPTAPRAAGTSPRRVESSPAPRQVKARQEDVSRDSSRTDEDIIAERRERRRERREQRREPKRNIDRIKDIFEGAPPS